MHQVGPTHEGLELGLGEGILVKAVAASTGKTTTQVKADVAKLGDLGKVIMVPLSSVCTCIWIVCRVCS